MFEQKYISPGSWFSFLYPYKWTESEDEEGSFLFFNPEKWSGNFRVSVTKGESSDYVNETLRNELKENPSATRETVGPWDCVYYSESFVEELIPYTTHFWIFGQYDMVAECSYTTYNNQWKPIAEDMVASFEFLDSNKKYPKEFIPIRLLEISEVNESYEWATSEIKKLLKKDFNSTKKDISSIQQIVDGSWYSLDQPEVWSAFGIAFGTILVNEMDGMEWVSVIDGKKEYPALCFTDIKFYHEDYVFVDVYHLIRAALKKNGQCDLTKEYNRIKKEAEAILV